VSPYCFDTDIVSALTWRRPPLRLMRRLANVAVQEQFTSAITLGELMYGAAWRQDSDLYERIRAVLPSGARILPFDRAAAGRYGELRADLERAGKRLAEPDLRIASIALARDLTLVTGNTRHFARVPGLRVEDWLRS
jgi:tRNA(fMet)-specific endonuclease VapC